MVARSKMKILSIIGFVILTIQSPLAQKVFVNNGVDTSNTEIKEVIKLWESYLTSRPDSIYDNPYWSKAEKVKYKDFDLLRNSFSPTLYMGFLPTVLSVKPTDDFYEIKTIFSSCTDSGYSNPLCVMNVYAKKENNQYKLFNALPINTRNWNTTKVGEIAYHYPSTHTFNPDSAEQLKVFIDSLVKLYKTQIVPIDLYLTDDFDELQKARGLESYMGMGNQKKLPGGRTDGFNKIIYSAGRDESAHEIVHIYLSPLFPKCNFYFTEGIATYYGGSIGNPLEWHIQRMALYLEQHPEIDLNDIFSFRFMDKLTNPAYVFGGLFCQMALEKGGIKKLKRLMNYGNRPEDFYTAIEKEFGIKKENLDRFLRKEIKKRVEKIK